MTLLIDNGFYYEQEMNERNKKWNKLFDELPDDVKEYIYDNFLDEKSLMFLNKSNYKKYHNKIINYIPPEHFIFYIKDIVENNLCFVFSQLLDEMFLTWLNLKYIFFKGKRYKNFLSIIVLDFCKYNETNEIINLIKNKFNQYDRNMQFFIGSSYN